MPWFTPPTRTENRPADDPFWWATVDRGISLLRESGVWVLVDSPQDDRMSAAEKAYQGGREYAVTTAEADELDAAGFGSGIVWSDGRFEPFFNEVF